MIQQRTENLIADINDTYIYSSIFGAYDGVIEKSFIIILHNVSPMEELEAIVALGEKYNQDSIIYIKQSSPVIQQLIYTTGKYQGRYVEGKGYEKLPSNVTDNYSRIQLCPNMTFEFTLNFNFKYIFVDKSQIRTYQLIHHHHHRNQQVNKERCSN